MGPRDSPLICEGGENSIFRHCRGIIFVVKLVKLTFRYDVASLNVAVNVVISGLSGRSGVLVGRALP